MLLLLLLLDKNAPGNCLSTYRSAPRVISSAVTAGGRWGAPSVTKPETRVEERVTGGGDADFCVREPDGCVGR